MINSNQRLAGRATCALIAFTIKQRQRQTAAYRDVAAKIYYEIINRKFHKN